MGVSRWNWFGTGKGLPPSGLSARVPACLFPLAFRARLDERDVVLIWSPEGILEAAGGVVSADCLPEICVAVVAAFVGAGRASRSSVRIETPINSATSPDRNRFAVTRLRRRVCGLA
ncbi:MAG: hypothetical protein R3A46_16405 [Thermomicrobiales bacterium]